METIKEYFISLEVINPDLKRVITTSPDGSLISVPPGYSLYFIYNKDEDGNPKDLLHCNIYKNWLEAILGLYRQYAQINEEWILDILDTLLEPKGPIDQNNLYTSMINTLNSNYNSSDIIVYPYALPITNVYTLQSEIINKDNIPENVEIAPENLNISVSPNVNQVLFNYFKTLTIDNSTIRDLIVSGKKVPENYHLYFLYGKTSSGVGELLYCNIHANAVDTIIGIYNQYKNVDPKFAKELVANLFITGAEITPDNIHSEMVKVITENYLAGNAPFYLKWFKVPTSDVVVNVKYEISSVQRKSAYNDFMRQRIDYYKNKGLPHRSAFRAAADDWRKIKESK